MKHIYRLFALLVASLMMASCQSDSNPFSGVDNRIISFELSVGDTNYAGQVTSDSTVVISVPSETDLNNAKVAYLLSERSFIIPKPEMITDWNSDQVFKVISENGSHRTYIIRINKVNPESDESVILTTDAEVKAFADKGVSAIHGNLIIGDETGSDVISNIDALTALTTVDYSIIINSAYKGKDLSGLRNLKSTGRLIIKDVNTLKDVTLKSLETVYDRLEIKGDSIETVELPRLKQVSGQFSLNAVNHYLTLPMLEMVGDLSLSGSEVSTIKMKKLHTINGSFLLKDAPKMELLDMSKVMTVSKDITIDNTLCYSGLNMPLVKSVGGLISIKNTSMASVSLNSLETVGGLMLMSDIKLSHITAPKLMQVNGDCEISGLPLKSLSQLSLGDVEGEIKLTTLASLTDLKAFLQSIKSARKITFGNILLSGDLDLSQVPCQSYELIALSKLDNLILPESLEKMVIKGARNLDLEKFFMIKGLKTIKDLSIVDLSVAESMETFTLSTVPEVTGTLKMAVGKAKKIVVSGLIKVNKIELADMGWRASYQMFSLPNLKSAESLSVSSKSIESIEAPLLQTVGALTIESTNKWNVNSHLTTLNGFKALSSISYLQLSYFPNFNDYTFIKPLIDNGVFTEKNWEESVKLLEMGYTPTFQDLKEGRYVQ